MCWRGRRTTTLLVRGPRLAPSTSPDGWLADSPTCAPACSTRPANSPVSYTHLTLPTICSV
eukprot:5414399-Alexandrium_andersonii.AAC.1